MDIVLVLLVIFVVVQVLRVRYQRAHITLLGRHLAQMQLEKHMETLSTTYTRAIQEETESRQLQVLATVNQTEQAVASQMQRLAQAVKEEPDSATTMGILAFNLPFLTQLFPSMKRDFKDLLQIHATGLDYVVKNEANWSPKDRAYHLSAELYLFQHSCHWFCKSRAVADARLMVRHKIDHKKVLESVSEPTRRSYKSLLCL